MSNKEADFVATAFADDRLGHYRSSHSPPRPENITTKKTAVAGQYTTPPMSTASLSTCHQLRSTPPMNSLTLLMITSFGVLALLGLSYWLRGKNKPKIPFVYWCFAQIYCFLAILGVGMMQAHLDCMSLWGDCYTLNYPFWLADYKPQLLNSIIIWSLLAGGATLINLLSWYRSDR
jgi:hypothetical protein